MSEPLTSVIMPTYNHGEFIGEAIESVLNQSYRNLELIIVDNYSEDDSQKIVESFNDDRIRYYKFSNNGIIAASRNYGIREAKGEYAAFIDSDDVWFKDKLKRQVDEMQSNDDFQMAFCRFKVNERNPQKTGKIMGPKDFRVRGQIYDKLIKFNFIVSSSVLLRSRVLEEVGFFDEAEGLRCAEDFDLWLRIARNNQVVFLPEILGMYRMHFLNSNINGQRLQKALNVIDKQFASGLTTKNVADRAKANFYFREGWFLVGENAKLARSYFRKAIRLNRYNLKIVVLSILGCMISYFPFFYMFLRKKGLDKKLTHLFVNPQSL